MFNTTDTYEDFLSDVQEAEGYEGQEGIMRIISENYENEMIINRLMNKADLKEMRMISESATEEEILAHQEASVSGVYNYLKGVLQRFWAKIKATVERFIRKVKAWFSKRAYSHINQNKKKINEFFAKLPTYDDTDNPIEIKDVYCPKPEAGEIVDKVDVKDSLYDKVAAIVASKGLDDSTDLRDTAFKEVIKGLGFNGFDPDYSSFKSDLLEYFFVDGAPTDIGKKELIELGINAEDAVTQIKGVDKFNNFLNKLNRLVNKEIKKITKKQKISGEAEQLKYENKAISLTNTFTSMMLNGAFTIYNINVKTTIKCCNYAIAHYYAVVKAKKGTEEKK